MANWGRKMFVTPGVVVDGELVTTDLVDINLKIRILLGGSYYDEWEDSENLCQEDPLGNPIDQKHPWNQTTIPRPQKREFEDKYTWVMSPRWLDKRTGSIWPSIPVAGPSRGFGRRRSRDWWISANQSHRAQRKDLSAQDGAPAGMEFEWKIPKWSNAIERDRARTYFQAYAAAAASTSSRRRSGKYMPDEPEPGPISRCRKKRSDAVS